MATNGFITVTGNATASATANGIYASSTSTGGHVRLTGNSIANEATGRAGIAATNLAIVSPTTRVTYHAEAGAVAPNYAGVLVGHYGQAVPSSPQANPVDVRKNTIYGIAGELTGTCYVPVPASVAAGVPVDATVGTAVLTAENVRDAVGLASANLDAQLTGLSDAIDAIEINPQIIRDAMLLAPSVGDPEAGSIDTTLGTLVAGVNVETVKLRPVGDVGEGNTAHLLQSPDSDDTQVARTVDVEEIISAIVAGAATRKAFDSVVLTTGTLISGAIENTYTSNEIYYVVAPVTPAVDGYGLLAEFSCQLADRQRAISLNIRGRFVNGGSPKTREVAVLVFNWVEAIWQTVSDGTAMVHETSDKDYPYPLLERHLSDMGLVKFRLVTTSTDTTDRLYIDSGNIGLTTLAPTAAAVAAAVRSELTVELGRVDAAISSRATPSDVTVARDAIVAAGNTYWVTGGLTPEQAETLAAILVDTDETLPGLIGAIPTTKDGYSLAPTGLDAITAEEPTGKPTNFVGWLLWLVQRFRRSDKTATEIIVKTEAGVTITTQAITSSRDDQTLGAPT